MRAVGSYLFGASNSLTAELVVGMRGTKDEVTANMGYSVSWASRQLVETKRLALPTSLDSRLRGSHTVRIGD